MTKEEFIKKYEGKAVHCDTEEKANEFLKLADSLGFKWNGGNSLIEYNNWDWYKSTTCYILGFSGKEDLRNKINAELEKLNGPQFTEDEKVILRNIPKGYDWIARDGDGDICIYKAISDKNNCFWSYFHQDSLCLTVFNHLFQSIKFEDKEPCEFRKFLDE